MSNGYIGRDYLIVQADSIEELVKLVDRQMQTAYGWTPTGGHVVTPQLQSSAGVYSAFNYSQAMVRK